MGISQPCLFKEGQGVCLFVCFFFYGDDCRLSLWFHLCWTLISWPYLSQIIKSHFCRAPHLTHPAPHPHFSYLTSSLGSAHSVQLSWKYHLQGVLLLQWILKVVAVIFLGFRWNNEWRAEALGTPFEVVRERREAAPFQQGPLSVLARPRVSRAPDLLTDPETTIWTPWPFPAASVEAGVIPAPGPGHPPGDAEPVCCRSTACCWSWQLLPTHRHFPSQAESGLKGGQGGGCARDTKTLPFLSGKCLQDIRDCGLWDYLPSKIFWEGLSVTMKWDLRLRLFSIWLVLGRNSPAPGMGVEVFAEPAEIGPPFHSFLGRGLYLASEYSPNRVWWLLGLIYWVFQI